MWPTLAERTSSNSGATRVGAGRIGAGGDNEPDCMYSRMKVLLGTIGGGTGPA